MLSAIWDRRAYVLKAALAGGLIALVAALLLPKRYESTTRLMPPDKNRGNMAAFAKLLDQNIGPLAAEAVGAQMPGTLFVEVLRSRTVEDDLVRNFDLRHVYRKKLWKDARARLAANTQIAEDRKSGVITLTVTAGSPQLAASLAGRYVAALNELMSQLDASSAHRERVFIEQRLKAVKSDLDHDSAALSQFSSQNQTLDPKEQGKTMVEAAAKLQGELIAAAAELRGLEQIYGPENARVRSAQGRIAELRRDLQQIEGNADGDVGYPSIRKLPAIGLGYSDLYRNVRIQEAVFENLTKQYEMAKVEEARDIPTVRVLDEAQVPEVKSGPHRTSIGLLGLLLGAALAAAQIVVASLWRETSAQAPLKRFLIHLGDDVLSDALRLRARYGNEKARRTVPHVPEPRHEQSVETAN